MVLFMKDKFPTTPAIRFLEAHKVAYIPHLYKHEEHGGTAVSSRELGVEEHLVVKTLIMEDETKDPFIVLMHGDMSVSVKELARIRGVKTVKPCIPAVADKHSGYQVGGTSPFGTKREMLTYIEESITGLNKIYINGGKKGFLVELDPKVLPSILHSELVQVGIDERK